MAYRDRARGGARSAAWEHVLRAAVSRRACQSRKADVTAMQSSGISKLMTPVALAAGAAALAALGAAPAVASTTGHGAASAPAASAASDATAQSAPYVGRVTSPIGLNIRAAAATDSAVLGTLGSGATFGILCKVPAGLIDGNRLWYKMYGQDGWVSARYVANVGAAPRYCH